MNDSTRRAPGPHDTRRALEAANRRPAPASSGGLCGPLLAVLALAIFAVLLAFALTPLELP